MNEKTITRILLLEIRDRKPNSVRFVVDDTVVNHVLLCVKTKKFDTILYAYGHLFLIELLRMFEEAENYEDCQLIVDSISRHNRLINDNLTTKL